MATVPPDRMAQWAPARARLFWAPGRLVSRGQLLCPSRGLVGAHTSWFSAEAAGTWRRSADSPVGLSPQSAPGRIPEPGCRLTGPHGHSRPCTLLLWLRLNRQPLCLPGDRLDQCRRAHGMLPPPFEEIIKQGPPFLVIRGGTTVCHIL